MTCSRSWLSSWRTCRQICWCSSWSTRRLRRRRSRWQCAWRCGWGSSRLCSGHIGRCGCRCSRWHSSSMGWSSSGEARVHCLLPSCLGCCGWSSSRHHMFACRSNIARAVADAPKVRKVCGRAKVIAVVAPVRMCALLFPHHTLHPHTTCPTCLCNAVTTCKAQGADALR